MIEEQAGMAAGDEAGETKDDLQHTTDQLTPEEHEAEAALARIEDRIGAFTAYTLAADLLELSTILTGTFERISEEAWGQRTDRRAEGWTRRETLAHVTAVASFYKMAIEHGLAGEPVHVDGMERREDLKTFNRAVIDSYAETPVDELTNLCLSSLTDTARIVAPLGAESLGRQVAVPVFGAPPTIAELVGSSLAHMGIVHGAQLAINRAHPLWIYFRPGLMRRQITRFVHMFGLAYWPERGGELNATVAINIKGQGGGSWVIRVNPEGGRGRIGVARTIDVNYTFASADLFCQVLTYQTQIWRQLLLRRLRVSGNLGLARRLPAFFMPT